MDIKVIKTKKEYDDSLNYAEELMMKNPDPESEEGEKLSLIVTLIKDYETKNFPKTIVDPIDAIKFIMEQQDLKPKDLIPYIGSKGKVSDILSRRRPLSLKMIRALQLGLKIPLQILINESDANDIGLNEDDLPIKLMSKRGYFRNKSIKEELKRMLSLLGDQSDAFALLRKSYYIRSPRTMNRNALLVWTSKVIQRSKEESLPKFKNNITLEYMQDLAKLSIGNEGPLNVIKTLGKEGIAVVIEPHLPGTYLDGAAILINKQNPIIGLTLRYDRLDNFWFNLMHELSHVALHSNKGSNLFYDDLDTETNNNNIENEADSMASEALVPKSAWNDSPAKYIPSVDAAEDLASKLHVNIAIVAGRMRKENNKYKYLNSLIGKGEVRKHFLNINWDK